jgi:hypothetical protein
MASKKRVLITIPAPEYRTLEEEAVRQERTPDQQATYLLRQFLARAETVQGVTQAPKP